MRCSVSDWPARSPLLFIATTLLFTGCPEFPDDLLRAADRGSSADRKDMIVTERGSADKPALPRDGQPRPELTIRDITGLDSPVVDHKDLKGQDHKLSDLVPAKDLWKGKDAQLVTLLDEGFETCDLSGWVVSGPGKAWTVTTSLAYQGTCAAMAAQTGAGAASYLEHSLAAPASGTVILTYYRRLVGLDTSDNFTAAYYSLGSWVQMESLGSANDATYILKTFVVPNGATTIRFACECGAVSEQCLVDSVTIKVQP